jgi:hypothetical protein
VNEPGPKLIVAPRFQIGWTRSSSRSSTEWRTCISYPCLGRASSMYRHGLGICIYPSMTCLGIGRRERPQHRRHCRAAVRSAQGAGRRYHQAFTACLAFTIPT